MITRIHQMTGKHIADLERLMERCKQADQNTLPIYKHLIDKRHTLPCNVLYYQDTQLIAYLRTFFFYTAACEVALMVDPEYRRQGIGRTLLNEIAPILLQERMTSLIFSTPKGQHKEWFTSLDMSYRNSEFQMQYDPQKPSTKPYIPAQIRLATVNDVQAIVDLDQLCFPKKTADAEELFRSLIMGSNCVIFVAIQEGQVVGKTHVFKETDRARVTDIGVFTAYRGRGIASALIKHAINHALINNKPKIVLDVEGDNESALKLYDSLGFKITNAHDYWATLEKAPEFGLSTFLHSKGEQDAQQQEAAKVNKDVK